MKPNSKSNWQIDMEQPEDVKGIHHINLLAFGRPDEADVIDHLRLNCPVFLSYVARKDSFILGHVLYTPAEIIQSDGSTLTGLGLAPLAVHPDYQRQGIGSGLCRESLLRISHQAYPFVIVLGHPGYYPRFGFKPAALFGVRCAYEDIPEDCFMLKILDAKKMEGVTGVAHYRPEFDSVS